ncbi:uncharacterized protein LOC116347672 [Contarinia nasturtii]|uniref:uncharacterized protein LOC116347672 n=1 Tax=Contarinia nasturtii TaxID=265458 RepID=UPI0012D4B000|nr:uncharacterized protein LOC116347672 [Contarinia nasturtii]
MGNKQSQAIVGDSSDLESSKIFKLNIDCFDEIFEYLSMKDLHSFGQTCKRMNKVAGEYFKRNHSSAEKFCAKDGIHTVYSDQDGVFGKLIQTSGFRKFMPCISIRGNDFDAFRYIQSHVTEFESTNHIHLSMLNVTAKVIEFIKELLPQLEIVQLRKCLVCDDLYELMLKHCTNLKKIECYRLVDSNHLLHEYPKLEHFKLIPNHMRRIAELREFFVRNPNVQKFTTTSRLLWENRDIFLNSNITLELLELNEECSDRLDGFEHSKEISNLLNQLYEQGFYKRLYLYVYYVDVDFSNSLISLKGLELLRIRWFNESYNLPQLTNLKELTILSGSNATEMEILANHLVKLERLYIERANIDDIMPFIRRSSKLNKIKMFPRTKDSFNSGVLNLTMLNEERAKLAGARKIIIYTSDNIFLATKWATYNGDTNLRLIEIRRADSYEWNRQY